jgi:hypothetical protein
MIKMVQDNAENLMNDPRVSGKAQGLAQGIV